MATAELQSENTSLAKPVAAEDLRVGDVVGLLDVEHECPTWMWTLCDPQLLPPDEPVRFRMRADDGGRPRKVLAICVPFVLLETPKGHREILDLRAYRLARLSEPYASLAWAAFGKKKKANAKK